MRKIVVLFALLGLGIGRPALAQQVDLEGYFIALNACEATQKKTSDNPGGIRLEIMRAYKMLARNDTPGTHYRVEVPGAPESEARWVPMDCGVFAPETALVGEPQPSQDGTETAKDTTAGNETAEQAQSGFAPDSLGYVLAASWQPGFCKTEAGQDKPECRLLRPGRFDALHFSLHGLCPTISPTRRSIPAIATRVLPSPARRTGLQPRRSSSIRISWRPLPWSCQGFNRACIAMNGASTAPVTRTM